MGAGGRSVRGGSAGANNRSNVTAIRQLSEGRPLFTSPETGSPRAGPGLPLRLPATVGSSGAVAHGFDVSGPTHPYATGTGTGGGYHHPNRPSTGGSIAADSYYHDASGGYNVASALASDRPLTSLEAKELSECTFTPSINRHYRGAVPVSSRYKQAAAKRSASSGPTSAHPAAASSSFLPTGMDECTFRPQTNTVKPTAMPAAALYVQVPIFERLTRTATAAQREREVATLGPAAPTAQRERDASADRSLGGAGAGGGGSVGGGSDGGKSGGTAVITREQHEAFLARQAAAERRKAEHIAALVAATAPPLQPQLCAKSLEMVEAATASGATGTGMGGAGAVPGGAGGASFLERVSAQLARKESAGLAARARGGRDPECTFQPAINPASKALPSRSTTDLSRGDALKKETAVRLMRLRVEAQQLEGVSFNPSLNPKSRAMAVGRLRLSSEPDTYLERVQQEALAAAERAKAKAAETEARELSECTFTPAVHDAPAYVKRIARSMQLARAVRAQEGGGAGGKGQARPDWR